MNRMQMLMNVINPVLKAVQFYTDRPIVLAEIFNTTSQQIEGYRFVRYVPLPKGK